MENYHTFIFILKLTIVLNSKDGCTNVCIIVCIKIYIIIIYKYEINTRTYENNVFVQYNNIILKCHRNRLHRLIILRLLQIFKCINITFHNHFLALITKKIV